MRFLRWCYKHKILAFWLLVGIVAIIYSFVVGAVSDGDYVSKGGSFATIVIISFVGYLVIIWLWSLIRRFKRNNNVGQG